MKKKEREKILVVTFPNLPTLRQLLFVFQFLNLIQHVDKPFSFYYD